MVTESLPQLEEELELILFHIGSEKPEDQQLAEEIFEEFLPRLEAKIDDYIKVIKWRESLVDFQLKEAQRIESLAHSNQQSVNWLKNKLKDFMERRVEQLGDKGKKLEGKLSKVSLCGNGGTPPVWIDPVRSETDFPCEYIETQPRLNRAKLISDAIDYGEVTDNRGKVVAKVLPRGKHLRIN